MLGGRFNSICGADHRARPGGWGWRELSLSGRKWDGERLGKSMGGEHPSVGKVRDSCPPVSPCALWHPRWHPVPTGTASLGDSVARGDPVGIRAWHQSTAWPCPAHKRAQRCPSSPSVHPGGCIPSLSPGGLHPPWPGLEMGHRAHSGPQSPKFWEAFLCLPPLTGEAEPPLLSSELLLLPQLSQPLLCPPKDTALVLLAAPWNSRRLWEATP